MRCGPFSAFPISISNDVSIGEKNKKYSRASCFFSFRLQLEERKTELEPYLVRIYVKNYRFRHTCNDNNDIERRKQQKLAY